MKIKELLSGPEKWTQHTYARDKNGRDCSQWSQEAVCWCLYGAVDKCYENIIEIDNKIREKVISIVDWNDDPNRTFEEVKALVEELDI